MEPNPRDNEERTVLAAVPMAQLVFGLGRGISPAVLCETAGIAPTLLADRDRFVPHTWYCALWDALGTHCQGVSVGIEFGKFMTPDHLGYAGQVFRHACDGVDALRRLVRFASLFDSRASCFPVQLEVDDRVVSVMAPPEVADGRLECVEASQVSLITQLRALSEDPPQVLEVHLHSSDQRHRAEYERLFGCPIRYGSTSDGLILTRESLRSPVRGANREAAERIEAFVVGSLATNEAESFDARLRWIVREQLQSGCVSHREAARTLGLSVRALQRRLSKSESSFAQTVEEVRRDAAVRMLRETNSAVYEIAFMLGYQDVSSFNRAFKRWLGISPSDYRARGLRKAVARDASG